MELNVIAIDIAKKVFQLHWVDPATGCIERLKLKRAQVLPWFANHEPAMVMMEACGGAHVTLPLNPVALSVLVTRPC